MSKTNNKTKRTWADVMKPFLPPVDPNRVPPPQNSHHLIASDFPAPTGPRCEMNPLADLKLPSLTDFPAWREAQAKLEELAQAESHLIGEIGEIEADLRRNEASTVDAEAAAYLRRPGSLILADGLRARHQHLRRELQILRRAREIHQVHMDRLKSSLAYEGCRELAPHHRKMVRQMAEAIARYCHVARAELLFRDELSNRDMLSLQAIRPMGFFSEHFAALDLQEPSSSVRLWLDEAVEFGFLTPAEHDCLVKKGSLK